MSKPGIFKTKIMPTLVAAILLLAAVIQIFVPLLGKETSAREIERDIIERDHDEHPELQFKWEIRYEYTDSQGKKHTGIYNQKGNATGSNVASPRRVYYLAFLPSFNVTKTNEGAGNLLSGLVFLFVGILILVSVYKKGGKKKKAKVQTKQNLQPLPGDYPNQASYSNQTVYPNQIVNSRYVNNNQYSAGFSNQQAQYSQMQFNQAQYKQTHSNQAPYNQMPYNQAPYNQAPYNQAPYNQAPYNQIQCNQAYDNPTQSAQVPKKQWQCPRCQRINQGNFCGSCGFPN
ncbi:MAG: hypothetical protein ACOX3H_05120 [Saccharofermentanales bacterium]|jgi:hypothetical protein